MKYMKKTYWWSIAILAFALILFGVSYVLRHQLLFGLCDQVYTTDAYSGCLDKGQRTIGQPLLLLTLALLLVTPFLFFVRDDVFKKWLWFALVWFGISIFFIALAPAYNHGLFSMMNPTKESVSLWMSVLFIPLSIGLLLWSSKRSKA
jgi:hypothetical protein